MNIFTTIYWNVKLFPFKTAIKLPIYLGYGVEMRNVKYGNIKLNNPVAKRAQVKIGITPFPTFPKSRTHTMIRMQGDSQIIFGDNINIMKGCSIVVTAGGKIVFGNDVFMNMHSLMYSNKCIKIGSHNSIGWYCQIYDSNVHYMIDIKTGIVEDAKKEILIGDNVWIANHVTVGPGAKIPSFSTVAANSIVNKDFSMEEAGGILVGMPAKYIFVGKVRLLNDSIEWRLKSECFVKDETKAVNVRDLGFDVTPLDGDKNYLFASK